MSPQFEAFRYDELTPDGPAFTQAFLSSYDFDVETLKEIARNLGLSVGGAKSDLTYRIAYCDARNLSDVILQNLVSRSHTAAAFKLVHGYQLPFAAPPAELVSSRGSKQWYGPINQPDEPTATWFIHPLYFLYKERDEDTQEAELRTYTIRWHCFARLEGQFLSLHWHGFTYQNQDTLNPRSRAQFPYWAHIPGMFTTLTELLAAQSTEVKLHSLILETILEQYRRNPAYNWHDDRIRAEAGGVSLNARAGAYGHAKAANGSTQVVQANPTDLSGITYLAITIRTAIERKLLGYGIPLPEPTEFDDEILITLIKKFGSQSYELRLDDAEGEELFNAHCYFGTKPTSRTPDAFPHLQFKNTSKVSDVQQLTFLLSHFDETAHLVGE